MRSFSPVQLTDRAVVSFDDLHKKEERIAGGRVTGLPIGVQVLRVTLESKIHRIMLTTFI
jgi:hypothetical protein